MKTLLYVLGFWSLLQTLTTAYGRASGVLSPRYLDLYAVAGGKTNGVPDGWYRVRVRATGMVTT